MLCRIVTEWALPEKFYSHLSDSTWMRRGATLEYAAFEHRKLKLRVLVSLSLLDDGSRWLHVSCSYQNKLPRWEDLRLVKNAFIGREVEAIQVLPKESEYVNLMPFCLHLWAKM